ncbi:MAG: hypothetical protein H7Z43_02930, partial [Clostridia bacterium]|nr:hypothetical protein [Deltaproteobacteria bacterium]
SVAFAVTVDDARDVTHLYVQCHACGYRDRAIAADATRAKATVSINGGPALALTHYTGDGAMTGNSAITVREPEASYGGIGGGFHTVRFTVPVEGIVAGINTLRFVHADPDLQSLGFRIIDLDFLRGGSLDARVLSAEAVPHDDPQTWTSPAGDVTAGLAAWFARDTLVDAFVEAVGGAPDGKIHAACSDCHARDGRDLSYFHYSNRAIIERGRFHGLSESEATNIATYIRSLDVPDAPRARPWNPPYQPGPGLDALAVEQWAAGAGLDAVLDDDAALLPYLFPRGTAPDEVAKVVDRYRTLNMRELPVAIQLPDWNAWLPRVHPLDAYDTKAAVVRTPPTGGSSMADPYFEVAYDTARLDPNNRSIDGFRRNIQTWISNGATCFSQTENNGPPFRAVDGVVMSALAFARAPNFAGEACENYRHDEARTWAIELAKTGLAAWLSVKQWELVHTNGLETSSQTLGQNVCSGGRCVDASEARGWGTTDQNVFFRAAHFIGFDSRRFRDEDTLVSAYGNSSWYHLQLVLNSGYRLAQPSHFPYTISWIHSLVDLSGRREGFRFWATYIKMRQLQTNGVYGEEVGLDLRTAQPFWLYSNEAGETVARESVGRALWKALAEALLTDLLAEVVNATPSDWAAADQNQVVQLPDSTDFAPCPTCFDSAAKPHPFDSPGRTQGRNTLRVVGKLRDVVQVDERIIGSLIDWAADMWPNADWDSVRL